MKSEPVWVRKHERGNKKGSERLRERVGVEFESLKG